MLEIPIPFSCPYCAAALSVTLDVTGGSHQRFVYDCEVCCSPSTITAELEGEDIASFSVEAES